MMRTGRLLLCLAGILAVIFAMPALAIPSGSGPREAGYADAADVCGWISPAYSCSFTGDNYLFISDPCGTCWPGKEAADAYMDWPCGCDYGGLEGENASASGIVIMTRAKGGIPGEIYLTEISELADSAIGMLAFSFAAISAWLSLTRRKGISAIRYRNTI